LSPVAIASDARRARVPVVPDQLLERAPAKFKLDVDTERRFSYNSSVSRVSGDSVALDSLEAACRPEPLRTGRSGFRMKIQAFGI